MQFRVEREISRQPEVRFVFSKTGTAELASDPMPPNASDTFIILKPRDQWPDSKLPKAEFVERLEQRLKTIPGNAYEITQPIQMRFNELIAVILRRIDGAADVKVEQTKGLPMLDIRVNRDAMARLGVTAQRVQDTISSTIGGREAGMIFEGDRRFTVTIRLSEDARANFETLGQVPVPTPGGAFVPLASVADISVVDGPNQISRENGKRRVVVQANVRGRDVAGVVEDARAEIGKQGRLPAGTYLEWGGTFEKLASARERLTLVVPVCFAVIILLLYGALGSVRDAVIVFTGVPLALVGGVLALFLRGMPFSISAAVGFIALSGIAVLNGLVMVTSIQDLVTRGVDRATAAYEGALARLRPVVMTAPVASLGFVPMAFATGPGAEVQKPLAGLNVKGAYLEVWADMLGSVGVIAGALLIRSTGWTWVDPVVAIGIGLWVLPRTWILLRDTTNVLLEGVPRGLALPELRAAIADVPGVAGVHDLHVWSMTSAQINCTARVTFDKQVEPNALRKAVAAALDAQFRIEHCTIQTEAADEVCEDDEHLHP